jgi:CDP-4-dehydro-6-deoxyglucose reductase, E3
MSAVKTTAGLSFESVAGKSILDAAIAAGLFYPYSCKTGRCKTCKCKVVSGQMKLLSDELGLTDAEKANGWALACVREPISDLMIEAVGVSKFSMIQVKMIPCRINALEQLTDDVIRVVLRLPPNNRFEHYAGQYIDVIKGNISRSYSIANVNDEDRQIELHIKRFAGGCMSDYWFNQAKVNDLLRLNGPLGTFFLRDFSGKNLIFLATGTGFAPVKAILENLSKVNPEERPCTVRVYWGGRVASDLYASKPDVGFPYAFQRVLSRSADGDAVGYVQDACLADVADFKNTQVFACGSAAMIEDARRLLVNAGLEEAEFYSDAFVCSASK